MNKKIKCPICNEDINKSGLKGHLRFKHQLSGEELTKVWRGVKNGEKKVIRRQEKQTRLERIRDLYNQLLEIRENKKTLEEKDQSDIFTTDEAIEMFRKLYNIEENRIKNELNKLLQEVEVEKEKESDWFDDLLP